MFSCRLIRLLRVYRYLLEPGRLPQPLTMAPESRTNVRFGGKSQTLKQKVIPRRQKDLMKARASRRAMSLRDCGISNLTRRRDLKGCDLFLQYCCLYREGTFDDSSWDTFMRGYIEQCWHEGEPLGRATYALCGLEWTHPPLRALSKDPGN